MSITLDELLSSWETDSVMDKTMVTTELLKTTQLHAKYLGYYVFFKAKLSATEKKYNTLAWTKRKYYRGEFDQGDLKKFGWSQWQGLKPSASELSQLLDMDKDMNELKEMINGYKTSVTTTEYILKEISGRSWILKTLVEYEKFQAGL